MYNKIFKTFDLYAFAVIQNQVFCNPVHGDGEYPVEVQPVDTHGPDIEANQGEAPMEQGDEISLDRHQTTVRGQIECWESGVMLLLRPKHFLTYDALIEVSTAIHEYYEMQLSEVKVINTVVTLSHPM